MNWYLIECANPDEKLRHYKNSRVAEYTVQELNARAGFEKYRTASDNDDIRIRLVGRNRFEGVNPYKEI